MTCISVFVNMTIYFCGGNKNNWNFYTILHYILLYTGTVRLRKLGDIFITKFVFKAFSHDSWSGIFGEAQSGLDVAIAKADSTITSTSLADWEFPLRLPPRFVEHTFDSFQKRSVRGIVVQVVVHAIPLVRIYISTHSRTDQAIDQHVVAIIMIHTASEITDLSSQFWQIHYLPVNIINRLSWSGSPAVTPVISEGKNRLAINSAADHLIIIGQAAFFSLQHLPRIEAKFGQYQRQKEVWHVWRNLSHLAYFGETNSNCQPLPCDGFS